jgi:hypothetical protein
MKNKIKAYFKKNKIIIIKFLLAFLWILLYILNYITTTRLIAFGIILFIIYIYKLGVDWVKSIKPIKNIYLLILLINIDKIKLLLIYFIIYLYIWLFDLLDWSNNNKLIKGLEWLIKSLIINPLLMLIHKYYYILYIWSSSSFRSIFLNRLYGMILIVLIFSPILSYIYYLLGYNLLNVYILIVVISLLEDYYQTLKQYKSIKLIEYILLFINILKINKDFFFILEYRNKASIFVILIKRGINQIKGRNSKINNYAFYINYMSRNILLNSHNDTNDINDISQDKVIIDYQSKLKNTKIMKMKKALMPRYWTLFGHYSFDITSELHHILIFLSEIEYNKLSEIEYNKLSDIESDKLEKFLHENKRLHYKLEKFYELYKNDSFDSLKLLKIEKLIYLLIKLILFYLWNILKLIGLNNIEIFNSLTIEDSYNCELTYNRLLVLDENYLKKINNFIKNEHFYSLYRDFYEQMYLYSYLWDFYRYKDKNQLENGINYNKYTYINEYIDILKENVKILNENWGELQSLRVMDTLEEEISINLNNYKNKLIKEWKDQSFDLSIENFYEKNNKNLSELNYYIKNEIKKI